MLPNFQKNLVKLKFSWVLLLTSISRNVHVCTLYNNGLLIVILFPCKSVKILDFHRDWNRQIKMHVCTHKIILNSTPGHKRYTLPRTFCLARNGQKGLCRRLTACLVKKRNTRYTFFSLNYTRVFFNWGQTRMLQFCCFKNFNLNFDFIFFLCRKSYCMCIFIYRMAHKIHFPEKDIS